MSEERLTPLDLEELMGRSSEHALAEPRLGIVGQSCKRITKFLFAFLYGWSCRAKMLEAHQALAAGQTTGGLFLGTLGSDRSN